MLADSVKHTVGVSQDLREGVRLSIEIIANEVVRRRAAQGLEPLPKDQAQVLAVQSLRFLYRILFLLWAEASPELGVLPVGAAEYEQATASTACANWSWSTCHPARSAAPTSTAPSVSFFSASSIKAPPVAPSPWTTNPDPPMA